jgi:aconitate hydratase
MKALEDIGATVLANACGPCIGQWARPELQKGETNVIVTSYNRNFPGRNDGNRNTLAFMGSPETVIAFSLSGRLDVDPLREEFKDGSGTGLRLAPPGRAPDVPSRGFVFDRTGYIPPAQDGRAIEVAIRADSARLQALEPFPQWDGKDLLRVPLLLKVKGKCTTDHISPAGPWLAYRGHLDRISDNMFTGAVNAFTGETGRGLNLLTGEREDVPRIARAYKARGVRWVVVGGENYGEGSSREHAAMEPRHLNGAAVLVKSFARIHETNLKKQGLLPVTFGEPRDYDKVREDDFVSVEGLGALAPGQPLQVVLHHRDGSEERFAVQHSFNSEQVGWFRAGSALNVLRKAG